MGNDRMFVPKKIRTIEGAFFSFALSSQAHKARVLGTCNPSEATLTVHNTYEKSLEHYLFVEVGEPPRLLFIETKLKQDNLINRPFP